ncbi:MAG: sulfatase-like hydrolase/transferase [Verrucomicrobiaceae bacterium]|nr:sulfatase-like hydrolase/transferase [Verrucomicrobiaceae bacterium]
MRFFTLFPVFLFALSDSLLAERLPNIVYIMSDELAYYELSHMGNPYIKTPRIDRMAAEGIRFTHAYAGSPVCAPLRCNLMTGKHAGHASVRANDGGTPLRAGEPTIASALKAKGYATGGFGKWGCGGRDSTGVPEKHGFDVFFGYYDQVHAHSFYPPYLIRNSEEVVLEGNIGGRSGKTYSHYRIMEEGLDFIRANKEKPFFCYFPITPPHGMFDIPADDPAWDLYKGEEWIRDPAIKQDVKNYAAMVSMVDHNVGQVLDLLSELGLEKDTIVFFTGDNGGQDRFRSKEKPRGFFGPNVNPVNGVEFRGGKGSLYEGGLRISSMVRWPGRIKSGQVSDLVFYQPDVFPTLAELAGAKSPGDLDGLSFLPTLLGGKQQKHPFLYWEFGNQCAVRAGNWKGVLDRKKESWELFDMDKDISEKKNLAGEHPDIVSRMKAIALREHTPAEPGMFTQRTRHERDRWAKWGNAKNQPPPKPKRGKVNIIKDKGLIPPKSMKILKVSSENIGNVKWAVNAIDGDPHTLWHSRFSDGVAKHPHELVIDLGRNYVISGFRYLARQDGGWNGAFAKAEFLVSSTPQFGKVPDLKATFGKARSAQVADLSGPVTGRYVKVRVLSEVNGQPFGSAAEIGVIGRLQR